MPISIELARQLIPFYIFAILYLSASSCRPWRPNSEVVVTCVKMAEVRDQFAVSEPRPLAVAGKIIKHGDYLFVAEPGRGIHIYDNLDPSSPVPKFFVNIPANSDMAVKGPYLYADSGTDLLTIHLDPQSVQLIKRNENILTADSDWEQTQGCQPNETPMLRRSTPAQTSYRQTIEENRRD